MPDDDTTTPTEELPDDVKADGESDETKEPSQPEVETYDLTDTQEEKLQDAGEQVARAQQQLQQARAHQDDIYELIAEAVGAPLDAQNAQIQDGTLHVVPTQSDSQNDK